MVQMYYDQDADLSLLDGKKVAVIGFGSQGHAQSQNLKESGVDVIVGLREGGGSWKKAQEAGLTVKNISDAAKEADVVQVLLPDEYQRAVYKEHIEANLEEGNTLVFSHGFNIHYHQIVPPKNIDVIMVAPKSPGHLVRRTYTEGAGVPGLMAIYQDYSGKANDLALAYAKGIGCTRAGVFETSFREETESDLFGEQVVLCGGMTELVRAGFDTLVDAGYAPEIAYFECLHELKLIVDLMYEGGIAGMRYSISDTAQWGDLAVGKRIVTDETRTEMKKILAEVQSGQFAKEWIMENQANRPMFNSLTKNDEQHEIEVVGKELRKMMTWLNKK